MPNIDDYESFLETIEIQFDGEVMKRIRKSESDLKNGKGISLEKINEKS